MDMSPDQEIVNTVLDSFGIMELVVEIEENFKITFLDEELLLKNFTTPSQIAHLVYDKLIQKVE
jgi:acyl carrier protein